MNRSTFITSLFALPATVKALAKSVDGDDIIIPDADLSNSTFLGAELYADDEHIGTITVWRNPPHDK